MMRTQLTTLSMRLSKALTMINPEDQVKGQQQRTKSVVQNAIDRISQEHEAILERKKIIENRKEFIEKETMNKRKKQRAQILAEAEEKRQKEAERLAAEALERERIRQQREREEIVMQQNMQRIESLRSNTMFKDLFKDVTEEDLKNLDGDLIMKKQVEELEKTKREQAQKVNHHTAVCDLLSDSSNAQSRNVLTTLSVLSALLRSPSFKSTSRLCVSRTRSSTSNSKPCDVSSRRRSTLWLLRPSSASLVSPSTRRSTPLVLLLRLVRYFTLNVRLCLISPLEI